MGEIIHTKKLDEISEMSSGGTPSRKVAEYWNGEIPWITTAEVSKNNVIYDSAEKITVEGLKNSSAKLFEPNSILLAMYGQGKTRGKVAILKVKATTNQACLSIRPFKDKINFKYLYFYLEKSYEKLRKMANSGGQDNLSMALVKELEISYPSLSEQEKIASFFEILDKKIQLQEQKINLLQEQKKGYMLKIFKQEVRFKDNDKEFPKWRNLQLGNCVSPLKGNSFNNKIDLTVPVLTISAKRGFVNQKERFSEVIAGNSLKKYTEVHKQDLSYNKGNSKTSKYGCVFVQRDYETALVPNVYKSFRANNEVEPLFLEYLFATKLIDRQLRKIITSTARMDGLLNVSDEDFYNMTIDLPILEEQKKIAHFLYKLDEKVQIEQQKLEALQKEKKGFIKKMFI